MIIVNVVLLHINSELPKYISIGMQQLNDILKPYTISYLLKTVGELYQP